MGLFKSMGQPSEMKQQAEDLQRQQLKRTYESSGLSGQIKQWGDLISQGDQQLLQLVTEQTQGDSLLTSGIAGQAVILGLGTPARGAQWFTMALDLEVHIPGRDAYRVSNNYFVPAAAALGPGVSLPVKVDPSAPAKLAIDWNAVPQRAPLGEVRKVASEASSSGAAGDDGDRIAALEQLANLHDSRALTDAEFAQAKARVLGS